MKKIYLIDTTLRDGMHMIQQQFAPKQMTDIASALDNTGIFGIEFGHGAGLGGNGEEYGFAAATDQEYLDAVINSVNHTKTVGLFIPGLGKPSDLKAGIDAGLDAVRIAINPGQADEAKDAMEKVRNSRRLAIGFMMMASSCKAHELALQAQKLIEFGAEVVYITDSAGAMLPEEVRQAVLAIKEVNPEIGVGFHGHNNLGLAITNSLTAIEAGATYIDCTLRGMGAGAGNTPVEIMALLLERIYGNKIIQWKSLLDAANILIDPILPVPAMLNNDLILLGAEGTIGNAAYNSQK